MPNDITISFTQDELDILANVLENRLIKLVELLDYYSSKSEDKYSSLSDEYDNLLDLLAKVRRIQVIVLV